MTLTDVSKFNGLALNQEAIVTKPIKAQSLYNAIRNLAATVASESTKAAKKKLTMDSSYAKVSMRDFLAEWVADLYIDITQRYPLKICYIDDSSVNVAVGKKVCRPT